MSYYFARPTLATSIAQSLLHPDILNQGLRSGLFMSGLRRTGKTTFLLNDLIPALEQQGALVLYVDLWSDTKANPAQLVRDAIRSALTQLQTPGSALLAKLSRLSGVDVSMLGFKFSFKLDKLGEAGGAPLAQAVTELVDQVKREVVLIVDEVQQTITTDEGSHLLMALKAARDAVNLRPGTPGHFIFVGTGSHRAMINELTARRTQAFSGASSVTFPVLGEDYVADLLQRLSRSGAGNIPSQVAAQQAFQTLGHRPEELMKALLQVQLHTPPGADPDTYLPVVASTLRSAAADIELAKIEQLGGLATAIFERIASTDGDATGIFSADAAAEYSRYIGREVKVDDIQPIVNELMAANIILRRGHGQYAIADPAVQEIWREKRRSLT
jgi:hypothetical protein